MSHFSNLLPSRPAAGSSSASASQHQQRGPADSRYQFDPLLRSTFGHRSVDLYGSHIDNREQGRGYYDDEDEDDEDEGAAYLNSRGGARQGTRSQHGVAGVGSSSLINASRYGPASASSRRDGGQLRDIEDEEDIDDDADDDDEYAAMAREEEDEQRQWGRGVSVRGLGSGGDAGHKQRRRQQALEDSTTTGMGSSEEDVDSRTPSASIVTGSRAQPATLDPFLVDDEDESGAAGRDDASASTAAGERRQGSPAVKKSKGKSATSAATTPVTLSTTARGWLAHSMAPASKGKGKSRPLRDAYSIYDDEDEGVFSSEEEEDSDDSEDEEGDDAHRNAGSASTSMHRPAKLSASSFPATHDDFHKKMPSANAAAADASSAPGSGSILFDVPTNYSSALGDTDMTSWKPWAAGNNPAWKQWKDRGALALWGFAIATTIVLAGGASLGAKIPQAPTSPSIRPSPYYTLTRSLPLLILLCALSLGMATLQLAFLRNLDRLGGAKVLRFALVATPACLTLAWAWAFAGSFFFDDEQWSGGSWSTTGLRTLSLIPLLLALFFSRLLYQRRAHLARSLSVLSLAARIVHAHPTLLLLSLVHIVVFLGVSMPFATIFIRLFLLGHFRYPTDTTKQDRNEWITDGRARVLAWATLATWIWTWAALRGIMRVTVSSVVSHWYFYGPPSSDEEQARGERGEGALSSSSREDEPDDGDDDTERGSETQSDIIGDATMPGEYDERNDASQDDAQLAHRNPTASDLVRASFLRATGPSLGTVLLSALLLAFSRLLVLISFLARTLASILSSPSVPAFLHPLASVAYLLSGAGGVIKGVSDYTLVYTGITGADFWRSSRRCSRLVMRRGATGLVEGLLIGTVLSLLTVSLSLLAALAGFLFSAHQLHVPADAPLVGLLCGVVPYWTLRLAADVLSNGADALSLCHYIDEQPGQAAGAAQEEDVGASQQEARQTMRGDDAGRGGGKDARSAKKQGAGGGGLLPL